MNLIDAMADACFSKRFSLAAVNAAVRSLMATREFMPMPVQLVETVEAFAAKEQAAARAGGEDFVQRCRRLGYDLPAMRLPFSAFQPLLAEHQASTLTDDALRDGMARAASGAPVEQRDDALPPGRVIQLLDHIGRAR